MQKYSETIDAITKFMFIGEPEENLKQYDLVILLGNDDIVGNTKVLKNLWEQKHILPTSKIVLSGNVGSLNKGKRPEAERLYESVIAAGLPQDLFLIENKATNSLENFKFSKPIIESIKPVNDFNNILCIARAFLTRRAKMCASTCNFPLDKITFYGTVDREGRNIGPDTWWQSETATIRVLEEMKRVAEYTLKGDLSLN